MPSPNPDVFVTSIALMEVTATTIIADCSEQRQRVNNPAVFIYRRRLVFRQIDKLLGVVIKEKFAVKSEVRERNGISVNGFAPDFLVAGHVESRTILEVKIIGFISIIADPADSTWFVVQKLGEGIDERILPPRMFQKLCKSIFAVNGTVEDFAIQAVLVTQNRAIVLSHKSYLLCVLRKRSNLGNWTQAKFQSKWTSSRLSPTSFPSLSDLAKATEPKRIKSSLI